MSEDDLDAIGEEEEDEGEDEFSEEEGDILVPESDEGDLQRSGHPHTTTAAPATRQPLAQVEEPVDEEMRRRMEGERLVKSGYLMKKGERRKTWKKRWFVLRTEKLAYYKDDKASTRVPLPSGAWLIFFAVVVGIRPLPYPQPPRHPFRPRRPAQEEPTPHDRPRYFFAHILRQGRDGGGDGGVDPGIE